jgi:hypothetical protein
VGAGVERGPLAVSARRVGAEDKDAQLRCL